MQRKTAALALTLLALAGCGRTGPNSAATRRDTAALPPATPAPRGTRPAVLNDSLRIEAMTEPFMFRLLRSPPAFPLPFSVYIPEDMVASVVGDTVRISARFAGRLRPSAGLAVVALPAGLDAAEARARARQAADAMGGGPSRQVSPPDYVLALAELRAAQPAGAPRALGIVALGRHGGRYFLVAIQYPMEMADGMGPRLGRILDSWRWTG